MSTGNTGVPAQRGSVPEGLGSVATNNNSNDGRGLREERSWEASKFLHLKQVMFTAVLLRIFNMSMYIINFRKEKYTQFP